MGRYLDNLLLTTLMLSDSKYFGSYEEKSEYRGYYNYANGNSIINQLSSEKPNKKKTNKSRKQRRKQNDKS